MFYHSPLLASHGIRGVFSDRKGGLGEAEEWMGDGLQRLCAQAGMPVPHQARQVHGVSVLHCRGMGAQHAVDADILLATEAGVALAVRTADCLPILLADKQAGVIVAAHAGWRGTVAGVATKAVQAMCHQGADARRIVASLGPCIGLCCFEVGHEVAQALEQACAQTGCEGVVEYRGGRCFADLRKLNQCQLVARGVLAEHIECSAHCTCCHHAPSYFSYRRDRGNTGRQLSMITSL